MEDRLSLVSSTRSTGISKGFEVAGVPSHRAWKTVMRRIFYHHWPKIRSAVLSAWFSSPELALRVIAPDMRCAIMTGAEPKVAPRCLPLGWYRREVVEHVY
jgi:hypothetical protein